MPVHIDVTGALRVGVPPPDAFTFFTPEGEKRWVAGWEPEYLHPTEGTLQEGLAFRTRHGGEETLWLVSRVHGPTEVDYVRVTPGSRIGTVSVRVAAAGAGASEVVVRYRLTGLSPDGDAAVEAFAAAFGQYLRTWEHLIGALLAGDA